MVINRKGVKIGIVGFCIVRRGCNEDYYNSGLAATPYTKKKALKITKALASRVPIFYYYENMKRI